MASSRARRAIAAPGSRPAPGPDRRHASNARYTLAATRPATRRAEVVPRAPLRPTPVSSADRDEARPGSPLPRKRRSTAAAPRPTPRIDGGRIERPGQGWLTTRPASPLLREALHAGSRGRAPKPTPTTEASTGRADRRRPRRAAPSAPEAPLKTHDTPWLCRSDARQGGSRARVGDQTSRLTQVAGCAGGPGQARWDLALAARS